MSRHLLPSIAALTMLLLAPPARAEEKPLRQVIDAAIKDAWQKQNVTPAKRSSDSEFLRRVYLDLAGSIPTYEETVSFLDDSAADKREQLIDRLLADPRFAQHQTDVWDLLLFGRHPPGFDTDKRDGFQTWLRKHFADEHAVRRLGARIAAGRGDQRRQRRALLRPVSQRSGGRQRGDQPDVPRRAVAVCPLPRSSL